MMWPSILSRSSSDRFSRSFGVVGSATSPHRVEHARGPHLFRGLEPEAQGS
jgi:hypothetical protein